MLHQSGAFDISGKTWEYIRFNLTYFMFSGVNIIYTISFMVALIAGIILLYRNASSD
jgi:hypothetical protein